MVLEPLTERHLPEYRRSRLIAGLGGEEEGNRATDGLGGRVAAELFGPGVPGRDDTIAREAHNGAVRELDDGGVRGHRLFQPLALGDVLDGAEQPLHSRW